jgi:hypothetical protein
VVEAMKSHTKRRKRRREKAKLKNKKAVRKHTHIGGRPGKIASKGPQAKAAHQTKSWPNPPAADIRLDGPLF